MNAKNQKHQSMKNEMKIPRENSLFLPKCFARIFLSVFHAVFPSVFCHCFFLCLLNFSFLFWCLDVENVHIHTLLTPQTCMRTDLESDLKHGHVHLNRPTSTSCCSTQNSTSAQNTSSHSYLFNMVAERQC